MLAHVLKVCAPHNLQPKQPKCTPSEPCLTRPWLHGYSTLHTALAETREQALADATMTPITKPQSLKHAQVMQQVKSRVSSMHTVSPRTNAYHCENE